MTAVKRLLFLGALFLGSVAPGVAFAECGGTINCIAVGATDADASVAHHGLGPPTFNIYFGGQATDTTSLSQTIVVKAVTGPLGAMATLGALYIDGPNASDFLIAAGTTCSPTNGPVHGGQNCIVMVAFRPRNAGPLNATVHIPVNPPSCAGCITERYVTLSGNGVPPTPSPTSAPAAASRSESAPYNTAITIDLGTTISGSYTSVAIASQPTHGTTSLNGNAVTYTPATGYSGADSFTYTATGPGGTSPAATVSITVTPPAAPSAARRVVSVPFETTTAIDLSSSITGPFTSIAIASLPSHGLASVNGNVVTYTPAIGYSGPDAFTYTATGSGGTSPPATVSITVGTLPPIARATTMPVPINTPTTLDLAAFIRGSAISGVTVVTAPAHGRTAVDGTRVTYTPNRDFFGADSFAYVATGNAGVSPPATVSVTVIGRPDPTKDAAVRGLLAAQVDTAQRFSQAQIANFQGRMESLHRGEEQSRSHAKSGQDPGRADDRARVGGDAMRAGDKVAMAPIVISDVASVLATGALNLSAISGGAATRFWIGGIAHFGTRGAREQRNGFDFSTSGVSIGADRRVGESFVVGAGLGLARDQADIGTDGSNSKARAFSGVVYGSYQPSPRTFVDALIGYGSLDFDSRRYVTAVDAFAQSDRKGQQMFASVAAGYEYRYNGVLVSPYARLDHSSDRLKQATESGAGQYALAYSSQTTPATQGALGLRAESVHDTDFGWAKPRARVEYRHNFQGERTTNISYADLGDASTFGLSSAAIARNTFVLGVGSDFIRRGGLTIGVDWQMQRASSGDSSQAIRLNLSQDLDGRGMPWGDLIVETTKPLDIQVEGGFMFDDNVTRAHADADKLIDRAYSVNVRRALTYFPSSNTRARLNLSVGAERFQNYNGLSRVTGGVGGEWQYRGSAEFGAPTFGAFAQASTEQFESRMRDGYKYSAGVSVRQSVTDRIGLYGALAYNERNARSTVFDAKDVSARLAIDFALGKSALYASGEYRRGHFATTSSPIYGFVTGSDVADDVFTRRQLFDYRFKGSTAMATLGYNMPLGGRDSLDFSWRHVQSRPTSLVDGPETHVEFELPRYSTNQFFILYLLSF